MEPRYGAGGDGAGWRTGAPTRHNQNVSFYGISVNDIDGTPRSLADFRGKVLLIVNVASRCGFTPQYAGLESLYRELKDRGFAVLGFPCNQFGAQEPGSNEEIA